MKIGGVDVNGPSEEVLVLPRLGSDVVFRAKAVLDMTEFNEQCPLPKAPGMLTKDGFRANTDSPAYKEQISRHATLRFSYIAIKSLEPSNIEWETVDPDNPSTWENWEKDLTSCGFSGVELQRITVLIMQANCLDEGKLKAAREAFLLGQVAQQVLSSGHNTEQPSTPSGEVVSG